MARNPGDGSGPDLLEDGVSRAPANQPPVFPNLNESTITVGQLLELDVLPRDPEGLAPILHIQNAPETSRFDDNGVGGRVLSWTPDSDDIGEHFVRFIAIDADDPALSTEVVRKITVSGG